MTTRTHRRLAGPTALVATLALTAIGAVPAYASHGGDDVVRRGACTGSTHVKVKAKHDDGRIEVEGEVDSNRNGQAWSWRLLHNGSVSARGTRTTKAPSGSFEVHRRVVDLKGTDSLTFRARSTRSGEVCRGTVRL
jgi:hypothetical protein